VSAATASAWVTSSMNHCWSGRTHVAKELNGVDGQLEVIAVKASCLQPV
jgi:hypothetical protein